MHIKRNITAIIAILILISGSSVLAQSRSKSPKLINVGLASVDITPQNPVRLSGFAMRKYETDTVGMPLKAKALAFKNAKKELSLIITVDLIGVSYQITDSVKKRLSPVMNPERLTICASHTHAGPEIGTLINILHYTSPTTPFDKHLIPDEQIANLMKYRGLLIDKLEEVALQAIANIEPSYLYWAKGQLEFGYNRRRMPFVDHEMPLMKITDAKGKIKGLFLTYACHPVCLREKNNAIHGDWIGSAQKTIEEEYPGAIALIAQGFAGDINPKKIAPEEGNQDPFFMPNHYGRVVADEVKRVLSSGELTPLNSVPTIKKADIELPLEKTLTTNELIENLNDNAGKGFMARLTLERMARGEKIQNHVLYPIQVWQFGDVLNMVFLGGEVVSEYAARLKKELGPEKLWLIAYSNDVSCYIPSKSYIEKYPSYYEADASMYYYDKPTRFNASIEDQIVNKVSSLLKR